MKSVFQDFYMANVFLSIKKNWKGFALTKFGKKNQKLLQNTAGLYDGNSIKYF